MAGRLSGLGLSSSVSISTVGGDLGPQGSLKNVSDAGT